MDSKADEVNKISCILCGGQYPFPGPKYSLHLINGHGVMHDIDFLVKASIQKSKHQSLQIKSPTVKNSVMGKNSAKVKNPVSVKCQTTANCKRCEEDVINPSFRSFHDKLSR